MNRSCTFVWGLVGDKCCEALAVHGTKASHIAGWNVPLHAIDHVKAFAEQQKASLQQLACGWTHVLLLLADGRAYVAEASQLLALCAGSESGTGSYGQEQGLHTQHPDDLAPAHQQEQQQRTCALQQQPCATDAKQPTQQLQLRAVSTTSSSRDAFSCFWQQIHLPTTSQFPSLQQPLPSLAESPGPLPPSAQIRVVQVAAGDQHCLLLTAAGDVWALGSNRHGQLGLPSGATASTEQHRWTDCTPAQETQGTATMDQFKQTTEQQLKEQELQQQEQEQRELHGANHAGEEMAPGADCFQLIMGPGAGSCCQEAIHQIAAGACHSAAVTLSTGRLYCWGWNAHGQCCTGTTADVLQPTLCRALDGVPLSGVAAGLAHTVCVSKDGAVYACGWNSHGQLGIGASVSPNDNAAVQSDAQQHQQGQLQPQQTEHQQSQQQQQLGGMNALLPVLVEHSQLDQEYVTQVACGSRHTLVLTDSGSVYAWGWNRFRQSCTTAQTTADVMAPQVVALPAAMPASNALQDSQVQRDVQLRSQMHTGTHQQSSASRGGKPSAISAGWWHSCVEC